jgi:hypothetical protein
MVLETQNGLVFTDTLKAASVGGERGRIIARYRGGTFFGGLPRPWMGLHAIDTVRRDAARKSIPFESRYINGSSKAEIRLNHGALTLVYLIDMEKDLIESIDFVDNRAGTRSGRLEFTYLEGVDAPAEELGLPGPQPGRGPLMESPGILWLWDLGQAQQAGAAG